ncbi:glycine cleavage system H protein [Trichophyton rubrum D6]|uniref:Glycine cleavage system H protein n=5 Tax=Trichophyton TaxID=5550 RepID=A0A178EY77_TRIRU|nr:glycine cleavage system H protein [Trichophyton rubrum CBS 118892]EZF23404.1 glycine cleavage system H protein [Trichophyton rubrum MR850]EZF42561.1 glycine cleavage system H protein [Trichophyton rubrum CBS 100081]EZF53178.1 glycine cleavage system H protein [Trichophyton rubrum CBS 288.86]EZF63846.1 glycine cleavage system H protein [Trichophyton rubrum CBS 289.86]EZF74166.1 glycine cleavage system H protein [Trichophyton soudanense CBS 452.61]EZF95771.1 glycine cleavage system H protein
MAATAVRLIAPLRSALSVPRFRASSALRYAAQPNIRRPFSQSSLLRAKKYTEQHEWIELLEDGKTATIGITEYAAKALGDVVYVELPSVDDEVACGDGIGAVESVKSASDIMSPASGKVIEVNTVLEEKPKTVNDSPEEDGWFAKIEVSDASELDGLMDIEAYKASLEEAD